MTTEGGPCRQETRSGGSQEVNPSVKTSLRRRGGKSQGGASGIQYPRVEVTRLVSMGTKEKDRYKYISGRLKSDGQWAGHGGSPVRLSLNCGVRNQGMHSAYFGRHWSPSI